MQNGIPVGLRSSPSFGLSRSGQLTAIIQSLFWDGSQGWWYDDNDTTTLFQDSAGTTPVTAVEQFVGLQLDKSKGLVLGPNVVPNSISNAAWVTISGAPASTVSGDQLTFGGQFSGRRCNVSTVAGTRYEFSFTAKRISGNTALHFFHELSESGNTTAFTITDTATKYTCIVLGRSGGGLVVFGIQDRNASGWGTIEVSNISVRELPGNHRYAPASGNRPIWSKRVNLFTKTEEFSSWTNVNCIATNNAGIAPNETNTASRLQLTGGGAAYSRQTVTPVAVCVISCWVKSNTGTNQTFRLFGNGGPASSSILTATTSWQLFSYTFTGTVLNSSAGIRDDGTNNADILVWGADLRPANQATGTMPLYQRVNTSSDYDTNGFPGYFKADGVDDFLQTNSIDFSAGPTNPPLGPELVVNGDGTTLTGWTSVNDASCTTAVSGGQFVLTTVAGGGARLRQTIPVTAGRAYRITGFVQANNNSAAGALQVWGTGYGSGDLYASAQVVNGTVSATVTATSANLYLQLNAFNSSSGITNYYDNISVKEITNANLGADKITLCAGVRKLSDASFGIISELSADINANNGAYVLYGNNSPAYTFQSKGSSIASAVTGTSFAAPITNLLTGIGNISGDQSILRINGTQVASSATDQGTGNYGNYPVYFFQRNGPPAANRFNGYEYGNIAVGKLLTADQTVALETYMNGLTRAY